MQQVFQGTLENCEVNVERGGHDNEWDLFVFTHDGCVPYLGKLKVAPVGGDKPSECETVTLCRWRGSQIHCTHLFEVHVA